MHDVEARVEEVVRQVVVRLHGHHVAEADGCVDDEAVVDRLEERPVLLAHDHDGDDKGDGEHEEGLYAE